MQRSYQDPKEPPNNYFSQETVKRIMEEFHQRYPRILPKKRIFSDQVPNVPPISTKITLELIEQFDITLQLLVQNILLCPNPATKSKSLLLLQNILRNKIAIESNMLLRAYPVNRRDFVLA